MSSLHARRPLATIWGGEGGLVSRCLRRARGGACGVHLAKVGHHVLRVALQWPIDEGLRIWAPAVRRRAVASGSDLSQTWPPARTFRGLCLVLLLQEVIGEVQSGRLVRLSGREGPKGEADAGLDAGLALQAPTPAAPAVRRAPSVARGRPTATGWRAHARPPFLDSRGEWRRGLILRFVPTDS